MSKCLSSHGGHHSGSVVLAAYSIYSNSPVKWLKFSIQPQTRQSMLKYLTHKLRTHTIDDDTKVKPISHLTPLLTRVTILHCTSKSSDRCNLMGMKYYYYANLPKWRLCWSWSSVGRVSGGTESSFHANVCATRMTMMIVGSSSSSLSVYHHQNIQQGIW